MKKTKKVGDKVYIECYTSMGQSSTGYYEIKEVDYKFDSDTGEKFPVYRVEEKDWFDGRDGSSYNNKESMYYIDLEEPKEVIKEPFDLNKELSDMVDFLINDRDDENDYDISTNLDDE